MYARTTILVLTGALLAAGSALAEDTTVIHKDRPGVVVAPAPGVKVERKHVETTGSGDCRSKTVHKEGMEGSTTIHKEKCD